MALAKYRHWKLAAVFASCEHGFQSVANATYHQATPWALHDLSRSSWRGGERPGQVWGPAAAARFLAMRRSRNSQVDRTQQTVPICWGNSIHQIKR
jgi:hypothetical protein